MEQDTEASWDDVWELVVMHHTSLLKYAPHVLPTPLKGQSEDIIQEFWLRRGLYLAKTIRPEKRVGALGYVLHTFRWHAWDMVRVESRRDELLAELKAVGEEPKGTLDAWDVEDLLTLKVLMDDMSEPERERLVLYISGHTLVEIAMKQGTSTSTVSREIKHSIETLKSKLE